MQTPLEKSDPVTLSFPYYKMKGFLHRFIFTFFITIAVLTLKFSVAYSVENYPIPLIYFVPMLLIIGILVIGYEYRAYKRFKTVRLYLNYKGISSSQDLSSLRKHPQYAIKKFDLKWSDIIRATIHPAQSLKFLKNTDFIKLTLHTKQLENIDIYPTQWCYALDFKEIKKVPYKNLSPNEIERLVLLSPLMRFLAKQNIKVDTSFDIKKAVEKRTANAKKFKIISVIFLLLFSYLAFYKFSLSSPPVLSTPFNQAESPSQQYTLPTQVSQEFTHFKTGINFSEIFTIQAVSAVDINKQGTLLAAGIYDKEQVNIVKIWDIKTGKLRHTFTDFSEQADVLSFGIRTIAFSPDSRWLVAGNDTLLYWWSLEDNKKIAVLESPDSKFALSGYAGFFSTQFSPNGKYLAAANWDGSVLIWETASRRLVHHITRVVLPPEKLEENTLNTTTPKDEISGHLSSVDSIVFSPDSKLLVSGGLDNMINIWDVKTGKLVRTLTGHDGWVDSLAFSPDGKLLASGAASTQNSVHIWDFATGQLLRQLSGHEEDIKFLDFRADGKVLVSSDRQGVSIYWEVSTGALLEKTPDDQVIKFDSTGQYVISVRKNVVILENETKVK